MIQMTTPPLSADPLGYRQTPPARRPEPSRRINLNRSERRFSIIGGGLMSLLGLIRGGPSGLGIAAVGGILVYRGASGHCPLYSKLGINRARRQSPAEPEKYFEKGIHVEEVLTINRSAGDLFSMWRDFSNLPRFMRHLKSVEVIDEKRSRWTADAPVGWSVQWEAEIINEEPDALIAWRSVGGVDVDNAGSVRFVPAPGGRGTEVRIVLDYIPPAGKLGVMMARIFGEDAEQQIHEDLRHFKQIVESGEISTSEGQPRGTCGNAA